MFQNTCIYIAETYTNPEDHGFGFTRWQVYWTSKKKKKIWITTLIDY